MRILLYPSSGKSQEVFSSFMKKSPCSQLLFPEMLFLFRFFFPRIGNSLQNIAADIGKSPFFPLLRQHVQ